MSALISFAGQRHCTVFSSRDAIIVVGFVLEKHFGGDFTRDQEKEIPFKRWPPGYQSSKLGLAPNGLSFTIRPTLGFISFKLGANELNLGGAVSTNCHDNRSELEVHVLTKLICFCAPTVIRS